MRENLKEVGGQKPRIASSRGGRGRKGKNNDQ